MTKLEDRVKWLHAPGHARSIGPRVVKRAVKSNALVIDWSEMYFNVDDLKNFAPGYNHFIGKPKKTDRRKRVVNHDVVISTRDDAKVVYDEEFFVDRAYRRNFKIHPERWGKARVIEYRNMTILIVIWHPQPAARFSPLILRGYKKSVKRVAETIRGLALSHKPDLILAGGDLQMSKGTKWYFPNKMANRLDLDHNNNHIDWQMWTDDWTGAHNHHIDASKINVGMDHRWMVQTLTPTKEKNRGK